MIEKEAKAEGVCKSMQVENGAEKEYIDLRIQNPMVAWGRLTSLPTTNQMTPPMANKETP